MPEEARTPRARKISVRAVAVLLIVLGLGCQVFLLATRRVPQSSDQAVVGLMARHILAGRGHPVFYWGATYAGSLEPHYVAGVFALAGASPAAYRAAMAVLVLALAFGVAFLTRRLFGDRAGLLALGYFAVPPFFLLYKGLTSDGAYDAVALSALAAVALALAIDRTEGGRGKPWQWLLLGVVMGMAWWVTPLTAGLSLALAVWLFARRRAPRASALLGLFAGGVAGAFPWWIWNLRHGWASLKAPETGLAGLRAAASNLLDLVWVSVPVLEGGVSATPDVRSIGRAFPLSEELALAALAVLLAPAALRALRGDRALRLLFLCLAAVLVLPAFSLRFVASEPRYAMAYYALTPALIGASLTGDAGTSSARRWRTVAAAVLLVVHGASLVAAKVNFANEDGRVTGDLAPLVRQLEATGVRDVYANYWTAYRLAFESGEEVIATPLTGDEPVRHERYREEVDGAADPAVVLLGRRDRCFAAYLREKGIPFRRDQVDAFGVYTDLGPGALVSLRAGLGLPLPDRAYRARWKLDEQPSEMPAGGSRLVRPEVMNRGPCRWPSSVHLGYHWWALDPGAPSVYDGPRGYLPRPLLPGEWAAVPIELVAPAAPGRYRLEYDLVHESVEWFSNKGGSTASVSVRVKPAGATGAGS
jgi:4-amino-4-deoxy-L-arabinose transferase-like glycosyltransferase